ICDSHIVVDVLPTSHSSLFALLFFFNHTAPPDIYTLPLHDALPIWVPACVGTTCAQGRRLRVDDILEELQHRHLVAAQRRDEVADRKSTRLNSSHVKISYAVFCLKKKKKMKNKKRTTVHKQILRTQQ